MQIQSKTKIATKIKQEYIDYTVEIIKDLKSERDEFLWGQVPVRNCRWKERVLKRSCLHWDYCKLLG